MTQTTKGSWHRKHDKVKYGAEFDRIFRADKKPKQASVDIPQRAINKAPTSIS